MDLKQQRGIPEVVAEILSLTKETPNIRREAIRLSVELLEIWDSVATPEDPSKGLSPEDANKIASTIGISTETLPNPELGQPPLSNKDALEDWLLQAIINLIYASAVWHNKDLFTERWFIYSTAPEYLEEQS